MRTKMTAFFAVLIIGLAAMGASYAHWSEVLTVTGSVETGTLAAEWTTGGDWDTEPPEKDFSWIECRVDPTDSKNLIVDVYNAYPSIDYYQCVDLHNTGSIPLHVNSIDFDTSGLPPCCTVELIACDDPTMPPEVKDLCCPPGEESIHESLQLHPSEAAYGAIHFHLCQESEEGVTYTFTGTVTCDQWNYIP